MCTTIAEQRFTAESRFFTLYMQAVSLGTATAGQALAMSTALDTSAMQENTSSPLFSAAIGSFLVKETWNTQDCTAIAAFFVADGIVELSFTMHAAPLGHSPHPVHKKTAPKLGADKPWNDPAWITLTKPELKAEHVLSHLQEETWRGAYPESGIYAARPKTDKAKPLAAHPLFSYRKAFFILLLIVVFFWLYKKITPNPPVPQGNATYQQHITLTPFEHNPRDNTGQAR